MHRFFASPSQIDSGNVHLTGDDVKHITKVLRLKPGDKLSICDGNKTDYICTITDCDKDSVNLSIDSVQENKNESNIEITLFQGFPKGDKLDYIIQKSVELGVCSVVPVAMKRSVAKANKEDSRLIRRQRIAEEAAKQCMRGIIPKAEECISYKDMLSRIKDFDLCILPYENETANRLKDLIQSRTDAVKIAVIIGPEGGFEEEEVEMATKEGACTVGLGPRIMRCETAPIAAISAVMYELGDW